MKRRLAAAGAMALLPTLAAATTPPAPGLQPCALRGVEHPAWCGQVQRPLDPAAAGGPSITVHFAVLPALSRQRKPDPVFFIAGGPGQSAIELAGPIGHWLARFSNRRDIVLVDQRGTGRSAPLRCDDDEQPGRELRDSLDPVAQVAALARCRQALQQLPQGDLRRYTTPLAMQDLDAVRRALGAERIDLIGVSYGTRAALDYLRQFPQAVRRVVLDGVAPPDMALPDAMAVDANTAFEGLLAWCEADADCRARHPRLREHWQRLLAALPKEVSAPRAGLRPARPPRGSSKVAEPHLLVSVPHPINGREQRLRLTPDGLAGLVRGPLYAPALAAALPPAIEEAAAGRWTPLVGLAAALSGGRGAALAQGMHFSVICSEDLPPATAAAPAASAPSSPSSASIFSAGSAALYRQVCAEWPRAELPADFRRLRPAPVPVLLLSGALDPVTPPRHGARVAAALGPKARHWVVPNAGHGLLGLDCLREQVFRFVNADDEAQALALDGRCADGLPRPPVFRPPAAAGVAP
ncbi:MAG: alpha/beta hydrolase [Proteobacteria bacterium]|nr:alpha/beta hydrolase [Pseudomonadota bacterium]